MVHQLKKVGKEDATDDALVEKVNGGTKPVRERVQHE
jgi:hypothetical protein